MIDLSRRDIMLSAGAVASAAAVAPPARAQVAAPLDLAPAWDLTDLYPNDAAWEAERQRLLAALPGLRNLKGSLGQGGAALRTALVTSYDLGRASSRLNVYASLKADADLRVAPVQEKRQLADDLESKLGEASAWIAPEVLSLGRAKVEGYLAADPALTPYRFPIEDILRQAPHTLGAEAEAVLAASDAPIGEARETYRQITSSDMPHPRLKLSTGETVTLDAQGYGRARQAPNRADRKAVFDGFFGSLGAFRNSLGSTYAASVKGDIFQASAHKYPNSLQAALAQDNLPEGVYRTLITETNRGLPTLHRYFELRRRMLGLPDMAYYDIYPPLVALDRRLTLPEMRTITLDAVKPLGPTYAEGLAKATAAKWMDPRPRPGKRPGAYMNPGAFDVHPYLLLNLDEDYEGLTTFAHEWGHAMHTVTANKAQPYPIADYPIFLAEIASTTNEQLLSDFMLANAKTKAEKLFYLGQKMEGFRGSFFRQAMFAEFEATAHDAAEHGEGISGESFAAIYLDLLKRYHGPKVAIDPVYANEWSYIPHFYTAFYVFKYATSITGAVHFARDIRTGGATARDRYLAVLAAGGSDYGYNTLRKAGLDLATPEPYRDLVSEFGKVMDQAEALL